MKRKTKLDHIIRIDLCINAIIIVLGLIAVLFFRKSVIETYTYLKDASVFISGTIPVLIVVLLLSFCTDIRYIVSKEPALVVEKYAIIWIIVKIIGIVFFLLSLLII